MNEFMKKYFPIYADPVEWSGTIVKNWFRFFGFGLLLAYITVGVIGRAVEHGMEAARYGISMIVFFQFMILYALRRLYVHIVGDVKKQD